MKYSDFAELYEELSGTTKKLEKIEILANFLKKLKDHEEWIYLLKGRVTPDYDESEFGISTNLLIKAIAKSTGVEQSKVLKEFHKLGDLGDVALELINRKRQSTLFSRKLEVKNVFENLKKLSKMEGKGAVERKVNLVVDLLSFSSGNEARWIVRTVLGDLRIGVADATLRDSIGKALFNGDKVLNEKLEEAYDKSNDFAEIFRRAKKGRESIEGVEIIPGRPMKVMLPVKVTDIDEGLRICGERVAVEHKYDGFRVLINKLGDRVWLFTRRLEDVTNQFPDVVEVVKKHVKGRNFILDSEVVGFGEEKGHKKYKPFEAISQRIKRKYDIEKLIKKLPVEVNVFDIIYLNGKSEINTPFFKRRKIIERIVNPEPWKIRLSKQIVTDDKKKIFDFYKEALKIGEEGVMIKKLDAPYRSGRRVGYMVKMKPEAKDLDLVIVGAEYGKGKRAGGLTSFILACKDTNGKGFLEVGKVSSGLKEKEGSEGTTYNELDKILQPLIIKEEKTYVQIKPQIVVSVTYQNIQVSPKYSSGFSLRFPRITHYRPERGVYDIATILDIKKDLDRINKNRKQGLG